jgi:hypothetical protein
MLRDTIVALGAKVAAERFALYGRPVRFRNRVITAVVAPGSPTLDLELGGGRERGTVRIQLPSTVNPRPEPKELIEILFQETAPREGFVVELPEYERKVRIETVRLAPPAGGGVWLIDAYDSGEY